MIFFKTIIIVIILSTPLFTNGQEVIPIIENLSELKREKIGVSKYWLEMGTNTFNRPLLVPVLLVQGRSDGPTLGLTAAIHGNELNGIPIIFRLIDAINTKKLKGRIIAIPGLNSVSMQLDDRRFIDGEDLNRIFPGKKNGSNSEQYAYKISERILPFFNVHIDMHTASFGRVNTMYARADLTNDTLRTLARLQRPDIILDGKESSVGSGSARTMRAETVLRNIPSVTIEYGNPQVFQNEMTDRGFEGILNTLGWLNMYGEIKLKDFEDSAIYCKRSYWIYMEEGGFLEIKVELNQQIVKNEKIAIVRDAFGKIIKEYVAPEDGVVIGKSSNPENMSGGRIIHLGVINK